MEWHARMKGSRKQRDGDQREWAQSPVFLAKQMLLLQRQRRLDDPGLKWCGLSGLGQGRSEEAGGVGLVEQR